MKQIMVLFVLVGINNSSLYGQQNYFRKKTLNSIVLLEKVIALVS